MSKEKVRNLTLKRLYNVILFFQAVKIIDRFLILYIRSADRLQRTARWVESLGENGRHGLDYLKSVIIDDALGICKDLDDSMEELVGTYFDEWAEVVRNPEKRALFRQVRY